MNFLNTRFPATTSYIPLPGNDINKYIIAKGHNRKAEKLQERNNNSVKMANNTLAKNIGQAVTDFADIKTAIIEKGVNVPGGTPTADYDDLIRQIQGDDIDLSNVVKYDSGRNVNLTGEGNLIMDAGKQIMNSLDQNIVKTASATTDISLANIPLGFNFRGKTIQFDRTDFDYFLSNGSEIVGTNSFDILVVENELRVQGNGFDYPVWTESAGWLATRVTIPDDKDYIVEFNGLNNINFMGEWNLSYANVSVEQSSITYGDKNIHTHIDSSDRPTWGAKQLATLDDISGEGGDNVEVFRVSYARFYGFEIEEIISEQEFNKIVEAYKAKKVVVFALQDETNGMVDCVTALQVKHTNDGINNQIYTLKFISNNGSEFEIIIDFKYSGNNVYTRWYYAYHRPHIGLINNLSYADAGIGALDAALGQRIVNTDEEQGITGLKIFEQLPQSDATPGSEWDITTKRYVDNLQPVILTQSEYDALGSAVEFNGITYYITPNPAYPGEVDTAPEPTDLALQVKKIYSTKYGSAKSIDFPDWSGGVTVGSVFDNEGKQVIKMVDLWYQPISFYSDNKVNNGNLLLKFYIYCAVAIPQLDVKALGPSSTEAPVGSLAVPAKTWTLFQGMVPASLTTINAVQLIIPTSIRYDIYLDHIYLV